MSVSEYIENLTEASLEGKSLPEPSSDEEQKVYDEFLETEALFQEVGEMSLGDNWQGEVWARIDADDDAVVEPDSAEPVAVAAGHPPSAKQDGQETGGATVIQAEKRFKWWPAIAGLTAAAAALIFVIYSGGFGEQTSQNKEIAKASAPEADEEMAVLSEEESKAEPADEESATEGSDKTATASEVVESPRERTRVKQGAEEPKRERGSGLNGKAGSGGDDEVSKDSGSSAGMGVGSIGRDPMMDQMAEGEAAESEEIAAADSAKPGAAPTKKRAAGWSGDEDMDSSVDGTWQPPAERPRPKPKLTAGEVNDNKHFEEFQDFLRERQKPQLEPMDVSERIFLRVLDANNKPIPNATVTFKAAGRTVASTRTYSDGWTLFHPKTYAGAANAEGFDVSIAAGQTQQSYEINRGAKEKWQVRMPVERSLSKRAKLDLVFLLDTTSSMADEIERLQETMIQIADEVSRMPGKPEVRFGLVLYRDDDDEYVSKRFDFESDVRAFQKLLLDVEASGGGDIPERLEVGLHRAIHEMDWDDEATRLVFLVADAPPHERSENEFSYSQDLQVATSKGIKVYPVATSGLDDDGEYVFRQLAQFTMARFIFLTGGKSGTETPHDVKPGSFQPETLDRLIIRLVREELGGLELE